jgi:hypothetical protein
MTISTLVALSAAMSLAVAIGAQQPARDSAAKSLTGTGLISGTVVTDERTPRPVRRATVSMSASFGTQISMQRVAVTDDAGRFAFTRLPAGTYSSVRVTKNGYVATTYGEKRYGGIGTPITLADGQRVTIAMKLTRGAVLTGTLLDRTGRPSVQTSVQASMVRVVNGERSAGSYVSYSSATTDDRGIYRIYGLPPGDYIVGASPRLTSNTEVRPVTDEELRWGQQQLQPSYNAASSAAAPGPKPASAVAYTPVYFPGVIDAGSAALVTLAAGQERSGVDFITQLVPTARVEGTIVDPDGQPPATAQISLVPKIETTVIANDFFLMDSMLMMTMRPTVVNGKFSLAGVRPGEYTITARAAAERAGSAPVPTGRGGAAAPMTLWASADISVNGVDQSGIALRLEPGMTLSGKVMFDGTSLQPPTDPSRVSIRTFAAPSTGVTVTVGVGSVAGIPMAADGTFKIEGLAPGRYLISASAPAATPVPGVTWIVRSAMVNGVNAADTPFEVRPSQDIPNVVVTFTDRGAEVSGTILDAAGKPTPDFAIMLFPTDRAMWSSRSRRIRQPVRASTTGTFKLTNLLPGEYYLAALTDYEPSEVMKPEFLEQLAAVAMKVSLAEGEKKQQDVKIAGG